MFPDPEGMLARLKAKGLHVSVWINPYIAQRSPLFAEGRALGHLLRRPDGSVWQWDLWQPGMALVDFTSPAARDWYAAKLEALLAQGVDCFKTDFGERVPVDVTWSDGSDPERMHNYYTYLYNRTVFDVLRKHRGEGEAVVFARSATTGSQQFPVHWGGDCEATYESMAESLRGGLSLGLSGFGFWSHDIGGFEGTPTPALFKRWLAFGLLSSHSRLHGSSSYRVPWLFDEESVDVARHFTRLKLRLMPYLYEAARVAHEEGTPMMRAMVLEFPADPGCAHLERQYMLGPDLLVAPVFSDAGHVTYYVPEGTWTHYLTGRTVTGPRWVSERHGFLGLPLLVRPGAVLPVGAHADRPDYPHADGVTLRTYGLERGAQVTVRVGDVTFTVVREGTPCGRPRATLGAVGAGGRGPGRARGGGHRLPDPGDRGRPGAGLMVKITDVARHAGVSPSTVSYALSGKRPISEETRRRVEEAARTLGYRPHAGARALASSRSNVLALVVPLRAGIHVPVVMQFAVSVVTAARQHDHDVLLLTQEEGEEGLRRVADTALVDALILMDVQLHDPRLPLLRSLDRPSVMIGFPLEADGLTCIDLDFRAAGERCVEHLAQLGHRVVALVGSPPEVYVRGTAFAQRVVQGFTAAADRAGLASTVHPCEATPAAARRVAEQLLREQPALTGWWSTTRRSWSRSSTRSSSWGCGCRATCRSRRSARTSWPRGSGCRSPPSRCRRRRWVCVRWSC